jgi:hypothetical protein
LLVAAASEVVDFGLERLSFERMSTKPVVEVFRNSDGSVVIREVDEWLPAKERGSIVVALQDVPAVIEMLRRETEGSYKDPDDSPTTRNLRPVRQTPTRSDADR